jgi:exodeoxyribonuclease-3
MKIATWNINSVRLRLPLLEQFNRLYNPDIICLQETKVQDHEFPLDAIKAMGFEYVIFSGEKSYNGVAILSKHKIDDYFLLSFYNEDKRHIAAKISDIELHNFYVPAGGDEPDIEINPKYLHKLSYLDMMREWYLKHRSNEHKIVLVGDLNIAPYEHDVWSSKQLRNVVSHTPLERTALEELRLSLDFIDTARHFIAHNEKSYSWWSYRNRNWLESDRGRRLDHLWVTPALQGLITSYDAIKDMRSWQPASDHVPCILELKSL